MIQVTQLLLTQQQKHQDALRSWRPQCLSIPKMLEPTEYHDPILFNLVALMNFCQAGRPTAQARIADEKLRLNHQPGMILRGTNRH